MKLVASNQSVNSPRIYQNPFVPEEVISVFVVNIPVKKFILLKIFAPKLINFKIFEMRTFCVNKKVARTVFKCIDENSKKIVKIIMKKKKLPNRKSEILDFELIEL
jgi:hypothetical protein